MTERCKSTILKTERKRKGGRKEGRKGETGMSEWFGRTVKKTTGLGATAALSLRVTVNDISKVARRGS